jgi:hypothetical protein
MKHSVTHAPSGACLIICRVPPEENRRPPERPWQLALAFLGAAAGLGLFLVGLGAAVMWVRLDAVGLPAELGVSLVPKQTLAIIAVHVLIEPLAVMGLTAGIAIYLAWRFVIDDDHEAYETDQADWEAKRDTVDEIPGPEGKGRLRLVPVGIVVLIVAVTPFEWFTVALGIANLLLLLAAYEVRRGFRRDSINLRTGLWAISVSFILLATAPALASEADKPSRLQLATVFLTDGGKRTGYFVSEDEAAVYIGAHRAIIVIPRERIASVRVTPAIHPRPFSGPRPLIVRALDPLF